MCYCTLMASLVLKAMRPLCMAVSHLGVSHFQLAFSAVLIYNKILLMHIATAIHSGSGLCAVHLVVMAELPSMLIRLC